MLNQNNITACLLLLQQQQSLQSELNKYCELIFCIDPILESLNLTIAEGNDSLTVTLGNVVTALVQAQASNRIIVNRLQCYIDQITRKMDF